MKKKFCFMLSLVAVMIYFAHSCAYEALDHPPDETKELLVDEAKRMFYGVTAKDGLVELNTYSSGNNGNGNGNNGNNGNGNGNGNNGNGNNGNNGNGNGNNGNNGNKVKLTVKPFWDYSRIEQNNEFQTVETYLTMDPGFDFVSPEALEKFSQTQKREYLQSKTSLIYLIEKKTGKTDMFLMTIVPDLSYLEYTKLDPFKKMSYLKRDNKFEGLILYHNLNGAFVNGWRYEGGEVVATVEAQSEAPDIEVITTRSGSLCTTYYTATVVYQCWDFYYTSGELKDSFCYFSHVESLYYFTVCDYSSGGGSSGGGGYGGGDPPPPLPQENAPCIKGSGLRTHNDFMYSQSSVINNLDAVLKSKMTDGVEWSISVGNSGNTFYVSNPQSNGPVSGSIPAVPAGGFHAYAHSHPNNTTGVPSPGDVYKFLELVRDNPSLTCMYIYGSGWGGATEVYALNVYDRTALLTFLSKYPISSNWTGAQTNNFTGPVYTSFNNARLKYDSGQCTDHGVSYPYLKDAVALAYMMTELKMGTTLTRKVNNESFKTISALDILDNNGVKIIDITNCN